MADDRPLPAWLTLERLVAQWRRSCEATRAELLTIRRDHPDGPRYGIAAVESCADDLEAALADLRAAFKQQQGIPNWAQRLATDSVLAGEIETTGLGALDTALRRAETAEAALADLRAAWQAQEGGWQPTNQPSVKGKDVGE